MKARSQAINLAKLMHRHQNLPEYSLALPPFQIKQKKLHNLDIGDILLLGLLEYEFVLLDNFEVCSRLQIHQSNIYTTLVIDELIESTESKLASHKFSKLDLVFAPLQSRLLEKGHKINITHIDLGYVTLYIDKQQLAKCQLVEVDGELAAKIVEVHW
jgi:hypothetical protein